MKTTREQRKALRLSGRIVVVRLPGCRDPHQCGDWCKEDRAANPEDREAVEAALDGNAARNQSWTDFLDA